MDLLFIRHGETDLNRQHRLMGQRIDAPLDAEGLEQAVNVLGKLPEKISAVYSSPLKRAAQTAEIIAKHYGVPVNYSDYLKERDFGSLSGKTWDMIDDEIGVSLSEIDKSQEYDYTQYGGESVDQVRARLLAFLEMVKNTHNTDPVIIVTHFGLISLMNTIQPGTQQHSLSNSSIHKFKV